MTLFTRIIKGEIPSYKVAEDDKHYAFLDINPLAKGHTLVIPKLAEPEADYIFDLTDEQLQGLITFAKKVAVGLQTRRSSRLGYGGEPRAYPPRTDELGEGHALHQPQALPPGRRDGNHRQLHRRGDREEINKARKSAGFICLSTFYFRLSTITKWTPVHLVPRTLGIRVLRSKRRTRR